MEPTQAKPAKKRRRWPIVAFVLVVASMCSWWYWPRGDARFVGKWDLTKYENGEFFYIGPAQAIEFRRDGRAVFSIVGRGVAQMFPFSWHAESTRICFGYRKPFSSTRLNDLYSRAMRWIYSAVDPSLDEADYEILSCTENDIWLLESGTRNVVELRSETKPPKFNLLPEAVARLRLQWHGHGRIVNPGETSAIFEKLRKIDEKERGKK